MARDLFGTDGVRGLAGEHPLDGDGLHRIGSAVAKLFGQPGQQVAIGADTRESSPSIVGALCEGLVESGLNVVNLGVITTPGLAYLTRQHDEFVAGVMVTASHNPYQYNGVKVFDRNGGKLSDETEAALNAAIEAEPTKAEAAGEVSQQPKLVQEYVDFLVHSAEGLNLHGLKIAVDTANGSASSIAKNVFEQLGANLTALSDLPNGININDHCGATDTTALQKAVANQGLDIGIAFDGDADRLIFVDNQGNQVNGDQLLYILAVQNGLKGVVATVMSNLGFEQALQAKGIDLVRTAVGDRYVLDGLAKTGYELGGEQSGHIVLPKLLQTGDGLLAAVQVLKALQESGKSLADWRAEVPMLPQSLVNISLTDKTLLDRPEVKAYIDEQTAQIGSSGRLLIRPSGTEPLARVMVEAPDAQSKAAQIAEQLQNLLQEHA